MPYVRPAIPVDGYSDSVPYRVASPSIAQEVLNVTPRDPWRERRRIGTRQGFVALEDMPANVQFMLEVKDYTSGTLSQYVIAIAGGVGYKLSTSGRTTFGASTATRAIGASDSVEGVQFGSFVYLVTGKDYYRIDLSNATLVIEDWTDSAGTYGSGDGPDGRVVSSAIPLGTVGAAADKIAVHGARLVLAGIGDSQTNWFMSAVDDPDDWDPTFGSGAPADAIAGGSTDAYGTLGEPITAIFPLGDTGFMFGCTNSLVYLNGDPQFGDTRLRLMSRSVGVSGKRAWCAGPEKIAFVCFTDGVYRVAPNDFDVDRSDRVTIDRLDSYFANLDFEDVEPVMVFDDLRRLVYLYLNRSDAPGISTHFVCDVDRLSWWPMTISDTLMPVVTSTARFRPLGSERPVVWHAGLSRISIQPSQGVYAMDGSPLASSPFNPSDNKAAFTSTLLMGPLNQQPDRRVLLTDARVVLAADQQADKYDAFGIGPQLTVIKGRSAQEAIGVSADVEMVYNEELILDGGDSTTLSWDSTVDGGDAASPPTDRAIGGFSAGPTGVYSPTDTAVPGQDQTYSGPGPFTLELDAANGWEVKGPGDDGVTRIVFYRQDAASDIPEGIYGEGPNILADASLEALPGLFEDREVVIERALRRGINQAIRMRVRAPDIFVGIEASGRSWALEDLSLNLADGGPVRQGFTDAAATTIGRR